MLSAMFSMFAIFADVSIDHDKNIKEMLRIEGVIILIIITFIIL